MFYETLPIYLFSMQIMAQLRVGQTFKDYQSFRKALKLYEEAHYCIFTTKRSTTAHGRNGQIHKRTTSGQQSKVLTEIKYSSLKLLCKHGGDYKSKGKGFRLNTE